MPNLNVLKPLPLERFVALVRRARVLVVVLKPGLGDDGHTTIATAHRLGVPLVVSDVPGISDYVTDGVDARLVSPGDPVALAEAVAAVWNEPAEGARLAEAGRGREAERCLVAVEGVVSAVRAACDGLVSTGG